MAKPLAVVPDLELELDNIYALPPAQFTSARNDLVRRLKQAGRDDAAAEVKELRKPTVPVWAVNQLGRRHPDDLAELLQSSEQLRAAQGNALGGGDSGSLRQATAAQRQALQTLTQRGHDLLTQEGHSATSQTIERIASTLRAAALDPASRELLVRGRLGEELDPAGFEALAGMPMPARTPAATRGKPASDKRRQERLQRLREDARKAELAADEAEQKADEAEREAERAATAAIRARTTAEKARTALEAAEQASTRR